MTDLTTAQTMLEQLGGNNFLALTGARNLAASDNSLSCKIGRNCKGITHIKIELSVWDTYTVTFYKIRGASFEVVKVVDGVYCDMLQGVFTENTGLDTHL